MKSIVSLPPSSVSSCSAESQAAESTSLETGNQIWATVGMPLRFASAAPRAAPSALAARTASPSGWRATSWRMLSSSFVASNAASAPIRR